MVLFETLKSAPAKRQNAKKCNGLGINKSFFITSFDIIQIILNHATCQYLLFQFYQKFCLTIAMFTDKILSITIITGKILARRQT